MNDHLTIDPSLRVVRASRIAPRYIALAALAVLLLVPVVSLVLAKPQLVSDTLLRAGGRIVVRIAARPGWAAVVAGSALFLVWGGIGLRCLFECASEADEPSAGMRPISPTTRGPSS